VFGLILASVALCNYYHTQDAILQREGETARVILVDWSRGALPSLENGQVYEQVGRYASGANDFPCIRGVAHQTIFSGSLPARKHIGCAGQHLNAHAPVEIVAVRSLTPCYLVGRQQHSGPRCRDHGAPAAAS